VKAKNLKELATKRLDDAKKEHARLSDELARVTEQQRKNELQDQVMHAFYAFETAENDLHSLSQLSDNAMNNNNTSSSSSSSSTSSSSSSPSSIMIDEIVSFCEDRVFRDRCLKVVIVAPPVLVLRNLAVRFFVEDGRRFALSMMIQNTESIRSKLSVGTILTINDPHCSISNDFYKANFDCKRCGEIVERRWPTIVVLALSKVYRRFEAVFSVQSCKNTVHPIVSSRTGSHFIKIVALSHKIGWMVCATFFVSIFYCEFSPIKDQFPKRTTWRYHNLRFVAFFVRFFKVFVFFVYVFSSSSVYIKKTGINADFFNLTHRYIPICSTCSDFV
jgi:hypothetical protein